MDNINLIIVISTVLVSILNWIIVKLEDKLKIRIIKPSLKKCIEDSLIKKNENSKIENNKNQTICQELLKIRKTENEKILNIVVLFILLYYSMSLILNRNTDNNIVIFLFSLLCIIKLKEILLKYRIRKGYYGTNYSEAKELLYYIKQSNNNNNINNKGRKIFDDSKESLSLPVVDKKKKRIYDKG